MNCVTNLGFERAVFVLGEELLCRFNRGYFGCLILQTHEPIAPVEKRNSKNHVNLPA